MLRLTKDQGVEKKIFSEQLSTLKNSKKILKLDLAFFLLSVICIIYSFSFWYIIPFTIFLWNIRNHVFNYRFNRAMSLLLKDSSSFAVSQEEEEFIYNFW